MRTRKFNIGDRVKIVSNIAGHEFKIGQEVIIEGITPGDYFATNDGESWYIKDGEAELIIAPSPTELLQSLVTMTALCRIKYGNLDKDVYEEILKAEAIIKKAGGQS